MAISESAAAPVAGARSLSVIDCIGIGINGVIGSGIFMLPALVFRHAGGQAPLAWLLVGGVCFLVGLCFAEAASHTDKSGGPYEYASLAFGREIGYAVGFIAVASMVLSYATVARGFAEHLVVFVPSVRGREVWVGGGVMAALAAANLVGLKPGAWTSNFFSAAKLLPLFAFVVVGLVVVGGDRLTASLAAAPAPRPGEHVGLVGAAMAGLFACTGFEFVSVPAGETKNPSRAVPLALLGSLGASVALYALVQWVAMAALPHLGDASPPIAAAAGAIAGPMGERFLVAGALVSSFGFCAGSALVGPVYLAAFATDGMAPGVLGRRSRGGSPWVAVLAYTVAAALLGNLGDFSRLADISNIAVVAQYLPTCLAVILLRRRWAQAPADPHRFRLAGGPVIPLLATAGCLMFLSRVQFASTRDDAGAWVPSEGQVCLAILAVGFALRLAFVATRRFTKVS